jgi:Carboxypeptidase regulatory-like domain
MDARKLRVAGICWLVLSGAGAGAHAQVGAGALAGEVIDQGGAPVPGAILTAIDVGTGLTRTVVTTLEGGYSIPSLRPGTYRVRAELERIQTLDPGRHPRRDWRDRTAESGTRAGERQRGGDGQGGRAAAPQRELGSGARHRQQEDRGAAAQRPQLHHAGFPRSRRGRAAAARRAAAAHQRRTPAHERVSVRRDLGLAARAGAGRVLPERGRDSGVQDREQQPAGRVRPLQRRRGQPHDEIRHQSVSRHRVRVWPP